MKPLSKIIAHLIFTCGLILLIIIPENQYSWMRDIDPSVSILPTDNSSDNRKIFALLILFAIVAIQLTIAVKTISRMEKATSMILILVAISVWSIKFL